MHIVKPLLKVLLSAVILLGVIVGAGVGYIWYTGQNGNVDAAVAEKPNVHARPAVIKPSKPKPGTAVGAAVHMITSPVAPGTNASITVKTVPTARCVISVVYDKTASKDSGLLPKAADDFGTVSWTWTVDANAPLGKWPAKVTCEFGGRSAVVIGDLVVAASAQQ